MALLAEDADYFLLGLLPKRVSLLKRLFAGRGDPHQPRPAVLSGRTSSKPFRTSGLRLRLNVVRSMAILSALVDGRLTHQAARHEQSELRGPQAAWRQRLVEELSDRAGSPAQVGARARPGDLSEASSIQVARRRIRYVHIHILSHPLTVAGDG